MTRLITIEDLYKIQFASRSRISPDGQRVAFVVTTIDEDKHAYRSAIWVVPANGGAARRFTTGAANSNSPSWSPDGRWLAFVSDREGEATGKDAQEQKRRGKGKPQIWVIPTDGGEARQLTWMEHGASAPGWSPDGKYILFNAHVGPSEEEDPDGKPFPKVRVIDRLWYKLDGVGFIHERRSHLFLVEATGGEPQQLTDGDWDDTDAAWSPDGSQIAFASNRRDDRWRWPGADIFTLTITNGKAGEARCLTNGSLYAGSPSWSPDGKTIAFVGSPKLHSAGYSYIYTVPTDAYEVEATCLTKDQEASFSDWLNSDLSDEHLAPAPAWSADGKTLYALASHRGATRLYAISSTDANQEPRTLTPGNMHVQDFSIDEARGRLALLVSDATHPAEVFVRDIENDGEMQRISDINGAWLKELELAQPELITYKGADDWPIEGWVLKPHDFDPGKRYPLVVEIHGGPNTQYGYGFFHEMQMLVTEGYVVLYTNPRGSVGYGYDFANAVRGAWGEKDSIDIMRGVDELLKQGYIDEQRIGVTGGSYGGFMTNWLVSHYDRFKVAVTDRCVSNMATLFGASDVGWDIGIEDLETTPWEDLDTYMRMSPITYVNNIHTPLLIIHSEQDLRCAIEQGEQLFTALQWLGRESKMVRFEGQSHGLSRGGHPRSRLERLRHIRDWFARYLK